MKKGTISRRYSSFGLLVLVSVLVGCGIDLEKKDKKDEKNSLEGSIPSSDKVVSIQLALGEGSESTELELVPKERAPSIGKSNKPQHRPKKHQPLPPILAGDEMGRQEMLQISCSEDRKYQPAHLPKNRYHEMWKKHQPMAQPGIMTNSDGALSYDEVMVMPEPVMPIMVSGGYLVVELLRSDSKDGKDVVAVAHEMCSAKKAVLMASGLSEKQSYVLRVVYRDLASGYDFKGESEIFSVDSEKIVIEMKKQKNISVILDFEEDSEDQEIKVPVDSEYIDAVVNRTYSFGVEGVVRGKHRAFIRVEEGDAVRIQVRTVDFQKESEQSSYSERHFFRSKVAGEVKIVAEVYDMESNTLIKIKEVKVTVR